MAEVIDRQIGASRAPSLEEISSRVDIFSEKLQSIERLIEKDSESKENQINLVKEYFDAKVRKSDDIMKFAQISVWAIIGVAALVAFVGYKSLEDFSKQSESIISSKIDRLSRSDWVRRIVL
ncbi:hypothetical protein M5E06_08955 [Azospirillum sp. A1-3]|uniref:hypothetical protein n=1 Tax=Azospirillum sp. A1-3 TaxID=185874 RepID=UPI0020778B58|nr:hypothetical protein [Azospirillum sp. A1-3]MCM8734323.1 hypothetical protein [Azospirillum sp. A1-3]